MTKKLVVLLSCFAFAAACSSETAAPVVDQSGQPAASRPADPSATTSRPTEAAADPFSTPTLAFAHQLERVRAEDLEGLRACMVSGAKDAVVEAEVRDAKTRMGSVPASDIAAEVRVRGEYADIVQKSSIVLTTLVRVDGKWLAQDAWWSPRERAK